MNTIISFVVSLLITIPLTIHADDQAVAAPPSSQAVAATPKKKVAVKANETSPASKADPKSMGADASITPPTVDTRYGVWDALDKRSVYGQGVFPEPFLVDDSDGESNEARLDWLHTGGPNNQHTDNIHGELEKGFGNLTLELETAYERDSDAGEITEGMDNVDLGARYPFYEWVSKDSTIDNTIGVALEVGLVTHTEISHNYEVVPKIFDDLKFENFTLQSILGYSMLLGRGGNDNETDGGIQSFEYGFVFGYTIDHDQLAIPGMQQLIPVVELSGDRQMNKDDHGDTDTLGDVGFRANLDAIGPIQPRLGIVFVFPVDYGGRQDQSWGIDTSLVFEY
jgi:hypothetical protein